MFISDCLPSIDYVDRQAKPLTITQTVTFAEKNTPAFVCRIIFRS